MAKISIIVPAYNVEQYVERCLKSLVNQSIGDIEIIVVNDGSTDGTKEIIQSFIDSHKYANIIYYEKENGGLSDARNYGVKNASGEYLIFVDADDYVSENLFSDIKKYIEDDIDLIKWNPIWTDNNGNEIKREQCVSLDKVVTGEVGFNALYGTDPMLACVWNYCMKKSLFQEFPKDRYHEDFAIMPLIILQAKTMVITDKYEYYYVQTNDSIMRSSDKTRKKLDDILINYDNLLSKGNRLAIDKITKENLGIFGAYSLLAKFSELNSDDKEYFKNEIKKRKVIKNIKVRNVKQLLKRVYLEIKYQ